MSFLCMCFIALLLLFQTLSHAYSLQHLASPSNLTSVLATTAPNDVVFMLNGDYNDTPYQLTQSGLQLFAESDDVVIQCPSQDVSNSNGSGIIVNANATLNGVIIRNCYLAIFVPFAVSLDLSKVVLTTCRIFLEVPAAAVVVIRDNSVITNGLGGVDAAISMSGDATLLLTDMKLFYHNASYLNFLFLRDDTVINMTRLEIYDLDFRSVSALNSFLCLGDQAHANIIELEFSGFLYLTRALHIENQATMDSDSVVLHDVVGNLQYFIEFLGARWHGHRTRILRLVDLVWGASTFIDLRFGSVSLSDLEVADCRNAGEIVGSLESSVFIQNFRVTNTTSTLSTRMASFWSTPMIDLRDVYIADSEYLRSIFVIARNSQCNINNMRVFRWTGLTCVSISNDVNSPVPHTNMNISGFLFEESIIRNGSLISASDISRIVVKDIVVKNSAVFKGISVSNEVVASVIGYTVESVLGFQSLLSANQDSIVVAYDVFMRNNIGILDGLTVPTGTLMRASTRANVDVDRFFSSNNTLLHGISVGDSAILMCSNCTLVDTIMNPTGNLVLTSLASKLLLSGVILKHVFPFPYSSVHPLGDSPLSGKSFSKGALISGGGNSNISLVAGCSLSYAWAYVGAGIALEERCTLTSEGSVFSNMRSLIEDETFIGVQGGKGGVVYATENSVVILRNDIFRECVSETDGGAIFIEDAVSIFATNVSFVNNKALRSYGGAFASAGHKEIQLKSCFFNGNTASYGGGGLSYVAMNDDSAVEISTTNFIRNKAELGGAIYVLSDPSLSYESLSFHNAAAENVFENNLAYFNGNNWASLPQRIVFVEKPHPVSVYSGQSLPEVKVKLLDLWNQSVSLDETRRLMLSYTVQEKSVKMGSSIRKVMFGGSTVFKPTRIVGWEGKYDVVVSSLSDSYSSSYFSISYDLLLIPCPSGMASVVDSLLPDFRSCADSPFNMGAIVGPVVGVVVVILVCFAIWYHRKRNLLFKEFNKWVIDISDLEFLSILGTGNFGKVYKAKWRGVLVSVKTLRNVDTSSKLRHKTTGLLDNDAESALTSTATQSYFTTLSSIKRKPSSAVASIAWSKKSTKSHSSSFKEEVAMMCQLRHPNIVIFMGACTEEPNLCLVLEFMSRGNVMDLFDDANFKFTWEIVKSFAYDTACGMQYLHSNTPPILHLDLKSPNLLVDERNRVKVADFGLAALSEEFSDTVDRKGTLLWMAPEIILHSYFTECADVYSFGIILWELMAKMPPYMLEYEDRYEELLDALEEGNVRPAIPSTCPREWAMLMQDCWNSNFGARPYFTDVTSRLNSFNCTDWIEIDLMFTPNVKQSNEQ